MKIKIGLTGEEVELGQYREMNKNSLKAFFSVVIYPRGEKILDCRYFVQGDKRWIKFPEKKVEYQDGRQPEYIPYISFLNKDYLEQLKIAILTALKDAKPQEYHGNKAQVQSPTRQANQLPSEPSFDFDRPPF